MAAFVSSVYGPVKSWRYGASLGIDPIIQTSYCSFNCLYCQLGYIQQISAQRKKFIETSQVVEDLAAFDLSQIDVITFSGNGEPTLATNFGQMREAIAQLYRGPLHILTNATTLDDPDVASEIIHFDEICCKLDAFNDADLHKINRPAQNYRVEAIVNSIAKLRAKLKAEIAKPLREGPSPQLTLQTIVLPHFLPNIEDFSAAIEKIDPDYVFLNRPKRPYPKNWQVEYRGSHVQKSDQSHELGKVLPQISEEQAREYFAPLIARFGSKIVLN